jgi:hypothetical protein
VAAAAVAPVDLPTLEGLGWLARRCLRTVAVAGFSAGCAKHFAARAVAAPRRGGCGRCQLAMSCLARVRSRAPMPGWPEHGVGADTHPVGTCDPVRRRRADSGPSLNTCIALCAQGMPRIRQCPPRLHHQFVAHRQPGRCRCRRQRTADPCGHPHGSVDRSDRARASRQHRHQPLSPSPAGAPVAGQPRPGLRAAVASAPGPLGSLLRRLLRRRPARGLGTGAPGKQADLAGQPGFRQPRANGNRWPRSAPHFLQNPI